LTLKVRRCFGAGCLFLVPMKTTTIEAAPLSAVFGGRGFRPPKSYDFVSAFEVAVGAGDSIPADSAKQSRVNQPQLMQQKFPAFEPREDRGSIS
jgi:hypothetical protein